MREDYLNQDIEDLSADEWLAQAERREQMGRAIWRKKMAIIVLTDIGVIGMLAYALAKWSGIL